MAALRALAVVACVGHGQRRKCTKFSRELYSFLFRKLHQLRVNSNIGFHSRAQCGLQCGHGLGATIRIAAVVRLCDARNEVGNAALKSESRHKSKENQNTSRNKRSGQASFGINLSIDVYTGIGKRVAAQCRKRVD